MKYRVLGPLEVLDQDGHRLPLGGARQQSVLASLLLRAGQTVSLDRLVEEVWESPPATASRTVQAYVSRLRHELPEGAIESRPGGYTFVAESTDLDLTRFERSAGQGHAALAAANYEEAAQLLGAALALWRGPPLAGLTSAGLRREAVRLEELRLGILEDRIEADLGAGRHSELVPELQALVAEHPLRDRLRAQLMRALYRAGRPGDALALYREGRQRLAEELGMEPGHELRDLEQAILRQDPALEPPGRRRAAVSAEQKALGDGLAEGPRPVDEALEALPEDGQPSSSVARALLLAMLGRWDEAWATAHEASACLAEAGGVNVAGAMGQIAMLAGDYETAAEYLQNFCTWCEQHGDRVLLSRYAPLLGRSLCALGRFDEAEPLAELGREVGDEHDHLTQSLWRRVAALVEASRGEHGRARRLAHEAAAISDETDSLNLQGDALYDLAEVFQSAGRAEQAVRALQQALDRYERKRNLASADRARAKLAELRRAAPEKA